MLVYINIQDNHRKMWYYIRQDNTIYTFWGRLGISMGLLSSNYKSFDSIDDTVSYASVKIREKLNKGYFGFDRDTYCKILDAARSRYSSSETLIGIIVEEVLRVKDGKGILIQPKTIKPSKVRVIRVKRKES